jgi:hypothetical protein
MANFAMTKGDCGGLTELGKAKYDCDCSGAYEGECADKRYMCIEGKDCQWVTK